MQSNRRILEIFISLYQGDQLAIDDLIKNYNVSKRTIQRDFSYIKESLTNEMSNLILCYDERTHTYTMDNSNHLNPREVSIISKILLESRALKKSELKRILGHLFNELSSIESKKIQQILANELLNYYPLQHQENILQLTEEMNTYIAHQTVLSFSYRKNRGEVVQREGLPVSLFFSEYYFYVLLYNPTYQKYLNYRLDRFVEIKATSKKIKIPYKDRLEDSELRKKMYFMYAGKEVTFTFRFWGIVEAALDKLPNGKVIKECEDESVVIEATAYDTGVIMWLLSQGKNVQVLSPPSFVEKIKLEIESMQKRYET